MGTPSNWDWMSEGFRYGMYDGRPVSTVNYYTPTTGVQANNSQMIDYTNDLKKTTDSWWDQYLGSMGDYIKANPIAPINGIGSIWSAYTGWKNQRDALNVARDNYNLQKRAWEANEARNQEAFNWQRQARASAQL